MQPSAPVRQALTDAAARANYTLPRDLWHVVLFYMTGETVRRQLEDGGVKGYTPMVYEIFARDTWDEYRPALESAWRPYVHGKGTLSAAAAKFVETLKKEASNAKR
jgi:hypothetical protein